MSAFAVPTFETARLILRAPRLDDYPAFAAFLGSDRAGFIGGPVSDRMQLSRAFGNLAGMWLLRGYGMFVFEHAQSGEAIGHGGAWHPVHWPEPELGWCIWTAAAEGQGFVTEAMTRLRAWVFDDLGWPTAVSYIDRGNHRSAAVARRLGAVIDPAAERPEGDDPSKVDVWRHRPEGAA